MDSKILEQVPYFSQIDNTYSPAYSCFPTSCGMAATYCLQLAGKDKTAIGCSVNMQIEDYFNETLQSSEIKEWMKQNTSKLGKWIWNYNPREIWNVEEYVFNILMNPCGFKAIFKVITYDQFCDHIEFKQMPIVLGGNYKSVSRVGAHVVCGVGFNKIGIKEIIVNDPYGSALKGYPKNISFQQASEDGTHIHYGLRFYRDGKQMTALLIDRI